MERRHDPAEKAYILWRKTKAFGASLCFFLFRLFPIRKNRIVFCTFEGKGGFGCNLKYLAEELHRRDSSLELIWLVNDLHKEFPIYIRKESNRLWSRAYFLSTARIWVDNYRKPLGTRKRKGQYYLNVNHFTLGIKCTGLLRGKGFSEMAYLVSKNDSDMIDGLVIDSKWCEACFDKAMLYNGAMLKTGAPRCDVLYGDRTGYKDKLRKRNGLPDGVKIVLYAPTFREGAENGKRYVYSKECSLDIERMIQNLETKFGGRWYVCLRAHPQLKGFSENISAYDDGSENRLIDESGYDDFYELLAGADAYITDYSSAIFEAGYAHIPAFIYADDVVEFREARGRLYWTMGDGGRKDIKSNWETHPGMDLTFPFSVAMDNDQLEEDILGFNLDEYERKLDSLHDAIGLVFDGKASERLAAFLLNEIM